MSVSELEQQIRAHINRPRVQSGLLADSARWNRLCSALDVIGDTELALAAFQGQERSRELGERYLVVYGVLQLLLVQQDAVKHVCEALNHPLTFPRELEEIRGIRSDTVGHPVRGKADRVHKSSFVVRATLGDDSLDVITVFSDGGQTYKSYRLSEMIATQRVALEGLLNAMVRHLQKVEMAHRRAYRSKPTASVFPPTLPYHVSKLHEGTFGGAAFQMGAANMGMIRNCVQGFREALEERGEWNDAAADHVALIDYPIERLAAYFNQSTDNSLSDKDAYIFCTFVERQLGKLQEIAAEIDKEYATDPPDAGEDA